MALSEEEGNVDDVERETNIERSNHNIRRPPCRERPDKGPKHYEADGTAHGDETAHDTQDHAVTREMVEDEVAGGAKDAEQVAQSGKHPLPEYEEEESGRESTDYAEPK